MRLILFRVSVPDKFLGSWSADVNHLVALHGPIVLSSPQPWPGLPNDFDTLPMVPSKQNSDLLRICELPFSETRTLSSLWHDSLSC